MKRASGKDSNKGRGRRKPASSFIGRAAAHHLQSDDVVKAVHALACNAGRNSYLVGGMVREALLGTTPSNDYDFVVSPASVPAPVSARGIDIAAFANRLALRLNGSAFVLDKVLPSYRVVFKKRGAHSNADISCVKGGGIIQDLGLRDFTVNAAAIDLHALFAGDGRMSLLIDPFAGGRDAASKLLQMTGPAVFDDDPLRSLRAVRLAARYGFTITEDTRQAMRQAAPSLKKVSAERVRDEMLQMFANPGSAWCMGTLLDFGLATMVFPELDAWAALRGYDLTAHSLSALEEAESMLESPQEVLLALFGRHTPEVRRRLDASIGVVPKAALFKLGVFFHDVGKASSMTRSNGVLQFIGHEAQGASIAKSMLRRLKFSRAAAAAVVNMIKNHHRVCAFSALTAPSERAKSHLFRACGNESIEMLCLAVADARATRRGGEDNGLLLVVKALTDFYFDVYSRKKPKPIMDGAFVIKTFGLKQGVIIGEILRMVNEEVEAGSIRNKKEAVAFVRRRLDEHKDSSG